MKKYILYSALLLSGLILGLVVAVVALESFGSDFTNSQAMISISDLEDISSKIYNTGDHQASVLILNYLSGKLKLYEESSKEKSLIRNYRIDRGLVHGRLYILYKNRGEEELSEKELMNAMRLLKDQYNFETEEALRNFIDKIDKSLADRKV